MGIKEIQLAAAADEHYQKVKQEVEKQSDSQWCLNADGLLEDGGGRLLVPNDLIVRTKIILEAHEPAFVGHFGLRRTKEMVRRNWKWPTLSRDVERVVESCDLCQRAKNSLRKNEAPIELMVAENPWEMVTLDFLSGFTPSQPGRWEGSVVVCDRFSRMMHVQECAVHPTAKEAANLFLQLVFRAHGVPRCILSDRGSQFDSSLWKNLMQKMGTRVQLASTHHPQTNGLTERMNRTLIELVKKVCVQHKKKWVEALPLLEFAYNNSTHSITGVSPFRAIQGQDPIIPAALLVPRVLNVPPPKAYAEELLNRLRKIWAAVQEAQQRMMKRVEKYENRFRGQPTFQEGDEVLCKRFQLSLQGEERRKQEFQYDGPFIIKRMIKPSVAELEELPEGAPKSINVQYLRKYIRYPVIEEQRASRPLPQATEEGEYTEWEVEEIQQHRGVGRRREFLVKWKGYPRATWTKESNLMHCDEALRKYWQRQPIAVTN